MAGSKKPNSLWHTDSERAQEVLDLVIHDEAPAVVQKRSQEVAVAEAKRAAYTLDVDTGRSRSRVLFITAEAAVLEPNSAALNHYRALAALFDELHVMVVLSRRVSERAERLAPNFWRYTTGALTWWDRALAAQALAKTHLVFSKSIRPDIIVATDPDACAAAAYLIGRSFHRPYQIHITDPAYPQNRSSFLHRFAGSYVLRHADAVRVLTDRGLVAVREKVGKQADIDRLPAFRNFSQFRDSTEQFHLSEKYSQYSFFILAHAPLSADSHLHDIFSALHPILHNPRIALVVAGEGNARQLFEEKARLLGIERNVIFMTQPDLVSLYRTANVLIEAGTDEKSEEHVLQAAMAGLPLIAYATDLRRDLFKDGESAFLCEAGEVICLTQKFNLFLNRSGLRTKFKDQMRLIAAQRIKQSPDDYYRALRDTIETTLLKELMPHQQHPQDTLSEATDLPPKTA